MDWQPIDTAPRDGTPVLLYCPELEVDKYVVGRYDNEVKHEGPYGRFCWTTLDMDESIAERCVSHWMPLPKPPTK